MSKHTVAQVEDMIATEDDAEVSAMLREYATLLAEKAEAETSIRQQQIPPAYATLLAEKENNGTTHWDGTAHYAGCIQAGPKHYECALQEIGRLRGTIMDLRVKLEAADNRNTAMMKMGDRLIAERAQSEYICTCGIRVTPHKCPTDNGF